MTCQVVMHRTHNNHYHKHRYNENYVAHPSLYESGENQERLACFHEDSGLEKSGTSTKEHDCSSPSPQMDHNATSSSPAAASPYPNPSYSVSFDHQSYPIVQPHQQHYYHPQERLLVGHLATQEQPLEANVSKSNTKERHDGSSGGSSPSEAQLTHQKRRETAEDLSQEQLPFTRVPTNARSETEIEGGEEGKAQYLTANCILLTYFNGDAANLVDAHFDRALNCEKTSQNDKGSLDGKLRDCTDLSSSPHSSSPPTSLPLSQRNFPASFWNSEYQSLPSSEVPSAASSLASIAGQSAHSHDLYPSDPYASAGTSMVDPWQNYMAAAASGHAAYYSAGAAAAAAGRLNQYHHHPSTAFLLQRQGRPSTSSSSSAAANSSAAAAAAAAVEGYGAAAYSAMTGLEGSMHQGTSKDLYWF